MLIVLGIIFVAIFIEDDQAGVLMPGLIVTFASSVIATFIVVLQMPLIEDTNIKTENE